MLRQRDPLKPVLYDLAPSHTKSKNACIMPNVVKNCSPAQCDLNKLKTHWYTAGWRPLPQILLVIVLSTWWDLERAVVVCEK